MPPTRQEFLNQQHQESTGIPYLRSIDTALGLIKTAAVSFDHLTNNPSWDRYLSYLQKELESAQLERNKALEDCGSAEHDIRSFQMRYHYFRGMVDAYNFAMGLPIQFSDSYSTIKQTIKTEVPTPP